jgi:cyanate permease
MVSLFAHPYKPMNLTMTLGFAIGIVGFSCYYFNLYSLPILAFLIIMMIENVRKPLGIALIAELSEDRAMASVLSVTSQAKSLIAAIVAALTGWAADSWGLATALIIVSSGLLLLYPFYRLAKPSDADR